MPEAFSKIRARILLRGVAPVKMAVAVSLAYHQNRHRYGRPLDAEQYERAMDAAARALARVADVYCRDGDGQMVRIPIEELLAGTFEQGGTRFKSADGRVYAELCLRRGDLVGALEILEKAS